MASDAPPSRTAPKRKAAGKTRKAARTPSRKKTTAQRTSRTSPRKKAASSSRQATGGSQATAPTTASAPSTGKLMSREQVLQTLSNEHKYMARIFEAFKEQLALLQEGQPADYNLMYDVMHYMTHFPRKVHHPREEIVFNKLIARDPDMKPLVEKIFIEHETQLQKGRNVLKLIRQIHREGDSPERREQLRIRCEDYLSFHSRHSSLEEGKVLPRVAEVLQDADWLEIAREMQPAQNPLHAARGERYKALNAYITDQLETAAAEFTLAEFIGMGALVESIGTLSTGCVDITDIMKKHFHKAMETNKRSFRTFWRSNRRSLRGLLATSVDCSLDSLDHYTEGLKEIAQVLRRTRRQIEEPYVSRMELFNEIEAEMQNRGI